MASRHIDELGRYPASRPGRNRSINARRHQAALGNFKIKWLVKPLGTVLKQHILARHTQVGGSQLHIGRDVSGTYHHQLDRVQIGVEQQLATLAQVLGRYNAGIRQ